MNVPTHSVMRAATFSQACALLSVVLRVNFASATPIVFDLYNGHAGSIDGSGVFSYTLSGVTLTASGYKIFSAGTVNLSNSGSVTRASSSANGAGGLGVDSGNNQSDTSNQIDWTTSNSLTVRRRPAVLVQRRNRTADACCLLQLRFIG